MYYRNTEHSWLGGTRDDKIFVRSAVGNTFKLLELVTCACVCVCVWFKSACACVWESADAARDAPFLGPDHNRHVGSGLRRQRCPGFQCDWARLLSFTCAGGLNMFYVFCLIFINSLVEICPSGMMWRNVRMYLKHRKHINITVVVFSPFVCGLLRGRRSTW